MKKRTLAMLLIVTVCFMFLLAINVKAANNGTEVVEPGSANAINNYLKTLSGGETINLKENSTYQEDNVEISKSVTIDGHGATINGKITVLASNSTVILKNMTLKFEEGKPIVLLNIGGKGNTVKVENVTFVGGENAITINNLEQSVTLDSVNMSKFYGKALYSDSVKNLIVKNSSFDASGTVNAGDHTSVESRRAGSAIDLNFGNSVSGVEVENIIIENNKFSNVKLAEGEDLSQSTAGAIKIKIKNSDKVTSMGKVEVKNNEFVDNLRDIVVGTQSVSGGTAFDSAKFDMVLSGNTRTINGKTLKEVKVTNNTLTGSEEERTETIPSNVTTTKDFSAKIKITIGEKVFEVTKGTTLSELDLTDIKTREGYIFKHFVIKDTDEIVSETQGLISDVTLSAVFEEETTSEEQPTGDNETQEENTNKVNEENLENPQTGDNILTYVALAGISVLVITLVIRKIR